MSKGKKSKGNHKESSGLRKLRTARRAIKRLTMKVNRWKKYQAAGKSCGGAVPTHKGISEKRTASTRSRHNGWDTSRMEAHIKFLEKVS